MPSSTLALKGCCNSTSSDGKDGLCTIGGRMPRIPLLYIAVALSMAPFTDLLLSVVALQGLVCNAPSNDSSFALAYFGPLLERTLSNQLHEVHCGWSAWARLVWLLPRWHRVKAVSLRLCFTKSSCTVETWDMLWTATGWPFVYLLLLLGVGLANCKQADAGRRSRLGRIVDNALTAIQTCPEVHTVHLICLQIIIRFPLNKFVALAWLSAGCAGVPLSRSAIFSMLEGPYGWVAYVSGALFIKAPFVGQLPKRLQSRLLFPLEAAIQCGSAAVLLLEAHSLQHIAPHMLQHYSPLHRAVRIVLTTSATILMCAVMDGVVPQRCCHWLMRRVRQQAQPPRSAYVDQQPGTVSKEGHHTACSSSKGASFFRASVLSNAPATSAMQATAGSTTTGLQSTTSDSAADSAARKAASAAASEQLVAAFVTTDRAAHTATSPQGPSACGSPRSSLSGGALDSGDRNVIDSNAILGNGPEDSAATRSRQAARCRQMASEHTSYASIRHCRTRASHMTVCMKIPFAHPSDLPPLAQLQSSLSHVLAPLGCMPTGISIREGCIEMLIELKGQHGRVMTHGSAAHTAVCCVLDRLTLEGVLNARSILDSGSAVRVRMGDVGSMLECVYDEVEHTWSAAPAETTPGGDRSSFSLQVAPPISLQLQSRVVCKPKGDTDDSSNGMLVLRVRCCGLPHSMAGDPHQLIHSLSVRQGWVTLTPKLRAWSHVPAAVGCVDADVELEVPWSSVAVDGVLSLQLWVTAAAMTGPSSKEPSTPPYLSNTACVLVCSEAAVCAEVQRAVHCLSASVSGQEEVDEMLRDLALCMQALRGVPVTDPQLPQISHDLLRLCLRTGCAILAQRLLQITQPFAAAYHALRHACMEEEEGVLPLHLAVLSGCARTLALVLAWERQAAAAAREAGQQQDQADVMTSPWLECGGVTLRPLTLLLYGNKAGMRAAATLIARGGAAGSGMSLGDWLQACMHLRGMMTTCLLLAYVAVMHLLLVAERVYNMLLLRPSAWLMRRHGSRIRAWRQHDMQVAIHAAQDKTVLKRYTYVLMAMYAASLIRSLGDVQSLFHVAMHVTPWVSNLLSYAYRKPQLASRGGPTPSQTSQSDLFIPSLFSPGSQAPVQVVQLYHALAVNAMLRSVSYLLFSLNMGPFYECQLWAGQVHNLWIEVPGALAHALCERLPLRWHLPLVALESLCFGRLYASLLVHYNWSGSPWLRVLTYSAASLLPAAMIEHCRRATPTLHPADGGAGGAAADSTARLDESKACSACTEAKRKVD